MLGQLDCSMSLSPQTAECAWTVGSYASSELANLTESWITTSAASSATVRPTITDEVKHDMQAFVNVVYTEEYYVTEYSDGAAGGAGVAGIWAKTAAVMMVVILLST